MSHEGAQSRVGAQDGGEVERLRDALAERDEARAEVARLREALDAIASPGAISDYGWWTEQARAALTLAAREEDTMIRDDGQALEALSPRVRPRIGAHGVAGPPTTAARSTARRRATMPESVILAIDPGPEQSAWVLYDGARVVEAGKVPNPDLRARLVLHGDSYGAIVIEQIASYGMPVGAEVFETCVWTGRFIEAVSGVIDGKAQRLPRREVKLHLCGQARAKDGHIRQALIDRFGGKERAIGKKAAPGPLYGIKADEWQALALAVTYADLHGGPAPREEE